MKNKQKRWKPKLIRKRKKKVAALKKLQSLSEILQSFWFPGDKYAIVNVQDIILLTIALIAEKLFVNKKEKGLASSVGRG